MKLLSIFLLLILSLNSYGFVNCFGKINNVYVAKNGDLTLHTTWKNGYAAICNVSSARDGVSPEVCKSWLSIALSAQVSNSTTVAQYGALTNCSEVPDYSAAPGPNYLMIYGLE